jgi:hypothetical protein
MKTYKKWANTELQYIKDNLDTYSDGALAIKLTDMTGENVSTAMIRRQRRKLGINKPRGRPRKITNVNDTGIGNEV